MRPLISHTCKVFIFLSLVLSRLLNFTLNGASHIFFSLLNQCLGPVQLAAPLTVELCVRSAPHDVTVLISPPLHPHQDIFESAIGVQLHFGHRAQLPSGRHYQASRTGAERAPKHRKRKHRRIFGVAWSLSNTKRGLDRQPQALIGSYRLWSSCELAARMR